MPAEISATTDIYGGITIKSAQNTHINEAAKLDESLASQIEKWQNDGVRSIWAEIDKSQCFWIEIFVKHDFEFHHTKPHYVMMSKWLCPASTSCLPNYPFTTIGVGGITLSSDGKFLMMKEMRSMYLGWKFPGGLADPGETLYQTAKREVLEETGVAVECKYILAFRQSPNGYKWKCDDFYFLIVCEPANGLSSEQNTPRPCPLEAADARWFSRQELEDLPQSQFHEFFRSLLRKMDEHSNNGTPTLNCAKYVRKPLGKVDGPILPHQLRTFWVHTVGDIDHHGDVLPEELGPKSKQ